MSENDHYLENPRSTKSKPFTFSHKEFQQKSESIKYKEDPVYSEANDAHTACMIYANAYTETMLTRAKVEDPEIFAMKGMSKSEMQ